MAKNLAERLNRQSCGLCFDSTKLWPKDQIAKAVIPVSTRWHYSLFIYSCLNPKLPL